MKKPKVKFGHNAMTNSILTAKDKYVLLCMEHTHRVIKQNQNSKAPKPFILTYEFIKERYGVSGRAYSAAKERLEKAGLITIKKRKNNNGNIDNWITLLTPQNKFELYESVFVTTPVYSHNQKIFIGLFYKILKEKKEISGYGKTSYSDTEIKMKFKQFGVDPKTVQKRLLELSWDGKSKNLPSHIPILKKLSKGYAIDLRVLKALYQLETELFDLSTIRYANSSTQDKAKLYLKAYPIYKKSKIGSFFWDEKKGGVLVSE